MRKKEPAFVLFNVTLIRQLPLRSMNDESLAKEHSPAQKKKIQLDIYEQKKAKNYNFPFYLALLALSAIITAAVLHGQNISLMRFLQSESKREKKIFLFW